MPLSALKVSEALASGAGSQAAGFLAPRRTRFDGPSDLGTSVALDVDSGAAAGLFASASQGRPDKFRNVKWCYFDVFGVFLVESTCKADRLNLKPLYKKSENLHVNHSTSLVRHENRAFHRCLQHS